MYIVHYSSSLFIFSFSIGLAHCPILYNWGSLIPQSTFRCQGVSNPDQDQAIVSLYRAIRTYSFIEFVLLIYIFACTCTPFISKTINLEQNLYRASVLLLAAIQILEVRYIVLIKLIVVKSCIANRQAQARSFPMQ